MKGRFCLAAGLLFCAVPGWAQTAAELERVLALPAVSCADAARFVLGAAGLVDSVRQAGPKKKFLTILHKKLTIRGGKRGVHFF